LLAKVAGALGLKAQQIVAAQVLDNGPVWFGLLLSDADTVLRLVPDHRMLKELGVKAGVAGVPVAEGSSMLIGRSNREGRPGHRQPQRRARAMADGRRHGSAQLHSQPGHGPGPRRPRARGTRRRRRDLDRRRLGDLRRRPGESLT
jgi:hypothetical protein